MYEHKTQPLLPLRHFRFRVLRSLCLVMVFIAVSLVAGAIGYHATEGLSWIDAFYNAALILSGMGPADVLHTTSAKVFASIYSLFSGLLAIAAAGLLLAPVFHRIIHTLHVDK